MSRKKVSWFGFSLTQKQSVQIFILSIVGLIISIPSLLMMVSPIIINIFYPNPNYDPYYDPDGYYVIRMIISMIPYIAVLCGIFLLSLYSLIRCRKIAKHYSPLIDPVLEPKTNARFTEDTPNPIAQFCPNCGKIRRGHEKFCPNCGQNL